MFSYKGHTWRKKESIGRNVSMPARFENVCLLTDEEYKKLPDAPVNGKPYRPADLFKRDFRPLFESDIYVCELQNL